jgi:hypothetical protein
MENEFAKSGLPRSLSSGHFFMMADKCSRILKELVQKHGNFKLLLIVEMVNELVKLRIKDIIKSKYTYNDALNQKVIWDDTIARLAKYKIY